MFDASAIACLLPHRFSMLMVDRILELEPGVRAVGLKCVSAGDPFVTPIGGQAAVLPSTVLMEAVAQVGAILVLTLPGHADRLPYLIGMSAVRCRRALAVGERAIIDVRVLRLRGTSGRLRGVVRVEGALIARGVVTFALAPRSDEAN